MLGSSNTAGYVSVNKVPMNRYPPLSGFEKPWVCPKCNVGLAPSVQVCPVCKPLPFTDNPYLPYLFDTTTGPIPSVTC